MSEVRNDEEWRPVPGFPGYDVSDHGRVRSWIRGNSGGYRSEPRIKAFDRDKDGYLHVNMAKDRKQFRRCVHHLVLNAFVGPRPPGMECRHFPNNDPSDNRLANLSWCTHRDNIADKVSMGTCAKGAAHGSKTKPDSIRRGERHWSRTKPHLVPQGERVGNAVLTEESVREIRIARANGQILREIAHKHGVSIATIGKVVTGKVWRSVG